jgi:RNA polymerase sigma factor (sigma-70 family)
VNEHSGASSDTDTWDAALLESRLADLLSDHPSQDASAPVTASPASTSDLAAQQSGLAQLNKYLSRAWYRAAIPQQMHEDSTQAVYTTLLQQLGRNRFDSLLGEIGHSGIKDVLSRETNEGVDFFRAVDMVKKRAQRERVHQSIDSVDVAASSVKPELLAWREALREAIDHSLSPREASLINETLMGRTPAEIALHWGIAPKTVSNEKTRALQKLRDALLANPLD